MKPQFRIILSLGLFAIIFFASCSKPDIQEGGNTLMKSMGNEVYHEWNNVFMEVERYAAFYRPGPAPRALAYMGYSAYEACIGGMPEYQSLQHHFGITDLPAARTNLYWPAVINASYGYLMNKFFQNVNFRDKEGNVLDKSQFLRLIQVKEKALKESFRAETVETILNNSEAHGQEVAAAIWRFASSDLVGHDGHLNPFPSEYIINNDCDWVPTDPNLANKGMFPQWGGVRTFATSKKDKEALKAPMACSTDPNSLMYVQAKEMMAFANEARNNPGGEFECIAQFWSDDRVGWTFSPAPRFIAIADQIIERENFNLQTACVLYAQLGFALNDACVSAWYNKYKYNLQRPISYIHKYIDPGFTIPWLGFSPPFPAYPSGHSSFGYAGAGILEYYVGPNYHFTDHCHELRTDFCGTPRSFNNLRDLAYENAFSRLPLGVHWRVDMEGGNFVGLLSAKRVYELPWKK